MSADRSGVEVQKRTGGSQRFDERAGTENTGSRVKIA